VRLTVDQRDALYPVDHATDLLATVSQFDVSNIGVSGRAPRGARMHLAGIGAEESDGFLLRTMTRPSLESAERCDFSRSLD
jgi:hypothetical protein